MGTFNHISHARLGSFEVPWSKFRVCYHETIIDRATDEHITDQLCRQRFVEPVPP